MASTDQHATHVGAKTSMGAGSTKHAWVGMWGGDITSRNSRTRARTHYLTRALIHSPLSPQSPTLSLPGARGKSGVRNQAEAENTSSVPSSASGEESRLVVKWF